MHKIVLLFVLSAIHATYCFSQIEPPDASCPGTSKTFTTNVSEAGYVYQWTIDKNDGNGYTPLLDNGTYSGTTTATLSVQNLTTSMYWYKYQCVSTNSGIATLGKNFILEFGTTWTGADNTSWENPNNWSCGIVPDSNTDVNVRVGASRYPVVTTNRSCRSLTVDSAAAVVVNPGINLLIAGNKSNLILNGNVHVIDSAKIKLVSDSSMLANSLYRFTSLGALPNFNPGDIMVGLDNNGFLVKVVSATREASYVNVQATQASMEEVFQQGNLDVGIETSDMISSGRETANRMSHTFDNYTLFTNGPSSVTLTDGNISVDPNWKFDFEFKNSTITHFELGCKGAVLEGGFNLDFALSQAINKPEATVVLKSFSKPFVKLIPVFGIPFPVVGTMELNIFLKYSFSADASMQRSISFASKSKFDLSMKYKNGQWTPVYQFASNNSADISSTTANINAQLNVALLPEVTIKFYKRVGAYSSAGILGQFDAGVVLPSLDWDYKLDTWIQTKLGAAASVVGNNLVYEKVWNTDTLSYKTPDSLNKVSGDFQVGAPNQDLINAIKVIVVDNNGKPQVNVPVYFNVTAGTGSLSNVSTVSNGSGIAQATWKIGSELTTQTVSVTAKKSSGSLVSNAPQLFTANVYIDTAALLVSHGTWKATAGINEDGVVLNDTGSYSNYIPRCDATETYYDSMDSLHLKFNANGTGVYSQFEREWGAIYDDGCNLDPYFDPLNFSTGFTWQFVPGEKKIRIIFGFRFWEIPANTPIEFHIISFSPTTMFLTTDADPAVPEDWGYSF